MRKMSAFNVAALVLGLAFLYMPIAVLVIYSFNASRLVAVWGGWSTRWYAELFNDAPLIDAAVTSLRVALASATAATIWEPWRRWRWCGSDAFAAGCRLPP